MFKRRGSVLILALFFCILLIVVIAFVADIERFTFFKAYSQQMAESAGLSIINTCTITIPGENPRPYILSTPEEVNHYNVSKIRYYINDKNLWQKIQNHQETYPYFKWKIVSVSKIEDKDYPGIHIVLECQYQNMFTRLLKYLFPNTTTWNNSLKWYAQTTVKLSYIKKIQPEQPPKLIIKY